MATKDRFSDNVNIKNKRAGFEYHFLDTLIAGMVLTGTEIKAIREAKINLQDGYCIFIDEELYLRQVHISKYEQGTYNNHDPLRDRKLLLNKREMKKLYGKSQDKGLTIIPVRLFINERGFAKIEIALAKGKKLYDKRENIKERDVQREMSREKY